MLSHAERDGFGLGSPRQHPTTKAVRRAIQVRQESVRALARRYGVSPTTVQKWRKRQTVADAPVGPKQPRSTVLSTKERRRSLLPFDGTCCCHSMTASMPSSPRSLTRPAQVCTAAYIDISDVHTEEGRL
jgi:hypothetical protein